MGDDGAHGGAPSQTPSHGDIGRADARPSLGQRAFPRATAARTEARPPKRLPTGDDGADGAAPSHCTNHFFVTILQESQK